MGSVMKILKGVGSLLRGIAWDALVGLPGNILGDMISDVVQSTAEKLRDARAVKNAAGAVTERMTRAEALTEARELLERIAAECGAPEGEARLAAFGEDLMNAMRDERITSAGMYELLSQSATYNGLSGREQRIVEDALEGVREALLTVHFQALNGESKALYKCIEALIDPKAFAEAFVRELRGSEGGAVPRVGEIAGKYAFAYIKHECPECHAAGERVRYDAASGKLVCGACGGSYTLTQNLESALSKEHFHATLAELELGLGKRIDTAVEDINAHADENMKAILEAIREQGSTGGTQAAQTPLAAPPASAVPHADAPAALTYVYFGEYPQSQKAEEVEILPEVDGRGYHKGSDGAYYAPLERVQSVTESKRRWLFKRTKRVATRTVCRYFKVEPLKWRVLSRQDGRVLLLCDTVPDAVAFGDSSIGGYDRCGLRSWLNCTFYDVAFSAEEKRRVLTTCVENGVKKGRVARGNECSDTNDKIFALSEKEATDPAYGFLPQGDYDELRRIAASAYAAEKAPDAKGWWLRSRMDFSHRGTYSHQLFVSQSGVILGTDVARNSAHYGTVLGVLPALCATFTAEELAEMSKPVVVAAQEAAAVEVPVIPSVYRMEGDTVWFGEYPQGLKAADVRILLEKDKRGYYLGSDGAYYAKVVGDPCDSHSRFSNGSRVEKGAVYYFKVEPIKWRVLQRSVTTAWLLCENILLAQVFRKRAFAEDANKYGKSDVRRWLNRGFLSAAFTKRQREAILTAKVDNSVQSTGCDPNRYAGKDTRDKAFLPSVSEMNNTAFEFSAGQEKDDARKRCPSDYAVATGALTRNGYGRWWLRSPFCDNSERVRYAGIDGLYCHIVDEDGCVARSYVCRDNGRILYGSVDSSIAVGVLGVVPALKIRL